MNAENMYAWEGGREIERENGLCLAKRATKCTSTDCRKDSSSYFDYFDNKNRQNTQLSNKALRALPMYEYYHHPMFVCVCVCIFNVNSILLLIHVACNPLNARTQNLPMKRTHSPSPSTANKQPSSVVATKRRQYALHVTQQFWLETRYANRENGKSNNANSKFKCKLEEEEKNKRIIMENRKDMYSNQKWRSCEKWQGKQLEGHMLLLDFKALQKRIESNKRRMSTAYRSSSTEASGCF